MANIMTDRKKNAGRSSQASALKTRGSEQGQPEKKAPAREEKVREESVSQESVKSKPLAQAERRETRNESKTPARRERDKGKGKGGIATSWRNNRVGRFIYEAYYELRHKVTWPTPREARNMTVVVIALSAVIGGIIALADYGLHQLFLLIIGAQ